MNGGKTKRSQTAILTHTGSIGSNRKIWNAIVKQTPTVDVPTSMDDMIDYLYLFDRYIDRFTDIVEVFTDAEIFEMGLKPYRIRLKKDKLLHLESFLYDCWTKISRKIFR